MLSLHQVQSQVQSQLNSMVVSLAVPADEAARYERQSGPLNPQRVMARKQNVSASLVEMGPLYRQLKTLGWTSTQDSHPVDRVSVLQRGLAPCGPALLRRDPDFGPGWWVVELAGVEHALTGSPLAVTVAVDRLMMDLVAVQPVVAVEPAAEPVVEPAAVEPAVEPAAAVVAEPDPEIKSLSPAAEVALSLKAEYPELASRIDAALAAVEAGLQPSYKTEWDNAGRYGTWSCNCPDAVSNKPARTRFGVGCKHALAGVIRQQVEQRQAEIRNREVEKNQERRARETALPAQPAGSILDWLDYDDDPRPVRKSADIIRQIEQENAERYARENARYANALRPDRANLEGRPNVTLKGIGHL